MDSRRKSLAKTVSWRIIAFIITAGIAWMITGELRFATAIGGADALVKLGLFYMHERVWNRVSFGRVKLSEYET